MLINLLGFVASCISFLMWLPQAKTTWSNRNNPKILSGISMGTQWMVVMNASIWGVYAVLTGAYWSGAPGLINLPLAVLTILLIRRSRDMVNKVEEDSTAPTRSCSCQGQYSPISATDPIPST